MKLIGWTHWDDPNYAECVENEELAIQVTIAYMKEKGLKFGGFHHLRGRDGVPVFDNNEKLRLSPQCWGRLMADVLDIEFTDISRSIIWSCLTPSTEEKITPVFKGDKEMKLIGWTQWFDPNYSECVENIELAIEVTIAYMKEKGLKFSGPYHQDGRHGVTVFDNNEKLCVSQRRWGGLMADVMDLDMFELFSYTAWAWYCPGGEEEIFPDESVCIFNEIPPKPDYSTISPEEFAEMIRNNWDRER